MTTTAKKPNYISGRLISGLSRRPGFANTTERRPTVTGFDNSRIGQRTDTREIVQPFPREGKKKTRILPKT